MTRYSINRLSLGQEKKNCLLKLLREKPKRNLLMLKSFSNYHFLIKEPRKPDHTSLSKNVCIHTHLNKNDIYTFSIGLSFFNNNNYDYGLFIDVFRRKKLVKLLKRKFNISIHKHTLYVIMTTVCLQVYLLIFLKCRFNIRWYVFLLCFPFH